LSMKKFLTVALVGAVVLGASSVVFANVCAFDPVPAATLLFPFVAYDYNAGASGQTTLFSITNVSYEAQIVHVTVWTDFSVAILDFNIILTGYDVQTVNIRDILGLGQLPVTLYEEHEDDEGVHDDGPVSGANELNDDWIDGLLPWPEATDDGLAGRCEPNNPAYPGLYATPIEGWVLNLFKGWLQSSQTADRGVFDCDNGPLAAYALGTWFETRDTTTPTWMYITADVVNTCNKTFPDSASYWTGEALNDNVLIGDVAWLNNDENFSEMDNAVHLEADTEIGVVATEGPLGDPVTFYARYSNPAGESDYREPLPTAWAFRYQGAPVAQTWVRAWKGSTEPTTIMDLYFAPNSESPTYMVANNCWAYTYYAWDEEENVRTSSTNPWSQPGGETVVPNLLPLETQEVPVEQFNTVGPNGWMLFVWPHSNVDSILGSPGMAETDYYQTWMGVKVQAFGQYSAATSAVVMANFNCFSQQTLANGLGVNFDYVTAAGYTVSAPLP